jgi:tRNA pseudouridine38-40 synthase
MQPLKFKLMIAFDGAAYHGWQSQRSGRGVQDRIEAALAALFPSRPRVIGSSRTDAGVHARALVAHCEIPRAEIRMPARHLPLAINALLPNDIRVTTATRTRPSFHARFDAISKEYHYEIWNHPVMDPLRRHRAWHVPRPLDPAAMRAAAAGFVGRHDFRAFTCNRGSTLDDATRTLTRCQLRRNGPLWVIILAGDGFLYKMCRGIVGTLVHIGCGKIPPHAVPQLLAAGDRRLAGPNAPAHGLTLWRVRYP